MSTSAQPQGGAHSTTDERTLFALGPLTVPQFIRYVGYIGARRVRSWRVTRVAVSTSRSFISLVARSILSLLAPSTRAWVSRESTDSGSTMQSGSDRPSGDEPPAGVKRTTSAIPDRVTTT